MRVAIHQRHPHGSMKPHMSPYHIDHRVTITDGLDQLGCSLRTKTTTPQISGLSFAGELKSTMADFLGPQDRVDAIEALFQRVCGGVEAGWHPTFHKVEDLISFTVVYWDGIFDRLEKGNDEVDGQSFCDVMDFIGTKPFDRAVNLLHNRYDITEQHVEGLKYFLVG